MKTKVEIVKFKAEHAAEIKGPRINSGLAQIYERNGFAYTAINGKALAAAGLIPTGQGRFEAWGLIGEDAKKKPFMLHRQVKRILACLMKDHGIRRVAMIVDPKNEAAVQWAERLGFVREGELYKFNEDGSSAILYARVK